KRGQGACVPRESCGCENASALEKEHQKVLRRLAPGGSVSQRRPRRQTKAGSQEPTRSTSRHDLEENCSPSRHPAPCCCGGGAASARQGGDAASRVQDQRIHRVPGP